MEQIPAESDSDEIPEITTKKFTKRQIVETCAASFSCARIHKTFIRKLMNENVTIPHPDDMFHRKCFSCENLIFKAIVIEGVVIGLQRVSLGLQEYMIAIVDDGTAYLDCYLDKQEYVAKCRERSVKCETDMKTSGLQSCNLMQQVTNRRLKTVPNWGDLKRGDKVKVIGRFTEFHGNRHCFVHAIRKLTNHLY